MTHFPIACAPFAAVADAAGLLCARKRLARYFHTFSAWLIFIAAATSVPAVVSGLVMTKGRMLGHGVLRLHHLFVWPAFAFLIAAAAWRWFSGARMGENAGLIYSALIWLSAGLIVTAAYWGGEMMISA
jgi:uncharacterized membrane protein